MPKTVVTCGQCKGAGRYAGRPCKGCGGDGHVLVPEPPTKCGQCKGCGRYAGRQCTGCGGSGWVRS